MFLEPICVYYETMTPAKILFRVYDQHKQFTHYAKATFGQWFDANNDYTIVTDEELRLMNTYKNTVYTPFYGDFPQL